MSWGRSRGNQIPNRNRGFTHFANSGTSANQPRNRATDNNNSTTAWNRVRANFNPGYASIFASLSKSKNDINSSNQKDNSNKSNHYRKSRVSVIPRNISLFSSSSDINIFNLIPRHFTITTNNSSAKFNVDILSKTSSIISKLHNRNPNIIQYHLDFDDEKNILQKLEKIYQGELVEFEPDDLDSLEQFKEKLKIVGFPEFYITNESNDQKEFIFGSNSESKEWLSTLGKKAYFYSQKSSIKIDKNLIKDGFQYFTIQTKKKAYDCNIFGVLFSQTIREIYEKDPKTNWYKYEIDDEENEFKFIVDLFNFQSINLTKENVYSIKKMAEDLKIDIVVKDADCFIDNEEKLSKSIDDQQNNIDMIEELLENLYSIKEKKVDFVAEMIKNSNWSETKENVYELAAFIFQVIENSIQIHEYIIDLLIKLNEEEEGNLKILLPFIVNNLILLLSDKTKENSCDFIIPFVYRMHKRNLIPKERLNKELIETNNPQNMFFVSWFLPELIEINSNLEVVTRNDHTKSILKGNEIDNGKLFYPCDINKIDEYKKMRDSGEFSEITKALQNDDVDKFQSFISSDVDHLIKKTVPKNMFEPFIEKDMGYLNYAAAYGSIKCFKYLMLNNEKVNQLTFKMAVFGGNNELIRIVDNEINNTEKKEIEESKKDPNKKKEPKDTSFVQELTFSIKRHRNELFDWILEQKTKKLDKKDLSSLFLCSIQNCNVHAMVQIIDNGFDYHLIMVSFDQYIKIASENGFYLLDQILLDLFNKDFKHQISISSKSLISFGNILIYKLFEKSINSEELIFSFLYSIKRGSFDIIKYIYQKIVDQKIQFNSEIETKISESCFQNHSKEILDFIIGIIDLCSFDVNMLYKLLDKTYETRNFEATKRIVDLIFKNNSKNDFTKQFIQAANSRLNDCIKYYIDKKCRINYNKLIDKIIKIKSNKEIYSLILKQIDPLIISKSINIIDQAILNSNKPLIESILDKNISYENALIKAVKKNDLEIVEIILKKHSEPSFVNKYDDDGTALIIAVKNENMQITKKLLSIPGIDPSIYDVNYQTPLIISAYKINKEFFDLIFDFYGEEIKKQKWQLEKSIEFIIKKVTNKLNNSDLIYILLKIINLNCIDPNIYTKKNTLLTFACTVGSIDLVNELIKYDTIDVNLNIRNTGDTPLITAIINNNCKNNEIIEILLSHPDENVNIKNYKNYSPLIFATLNEQYDVVNCILKNDKFDHKESNIYYAFSIANAKIAKLLLSYKLFDINYMDSIDINNNNKEFKVKSPLIKSIELSDIELLNLIIDNPSFVKKKSDLIDALKVSILQSKVKFFKKILENLNEFDIDINTIIFDGKTSMLEAIELNSNIKMISFILNNSNYIEGKNIIDLFVLSYTKLCKSCKNYYIKLMDLFYDYDCNHNHLIDNKLSEKESTFISEINKSVIDFMTNPKELLKEAIKEDSYISFLFLIESYKFDFNKSFFSGDGKYMYTSFLHLAINLNRIRIVKELLSRDLIDVNAKDFDGKTPLMEACKYKRIECIKLLFEKSDLDYKYKYRGEDAIEMTLKINQKHLYKQYFQNIQNKDEYLNVLLTALSDAQQLNKLAITYNNNNNENEDEKEKEDEGPNEFHPNKFVSKTNSREIFKSWDVKKSDDSNNKNDKINSNNKNKSFESKSDDSKSDDSKSDKSIQNSPTLDFEIYNESFFIDQKSNRNKYIKNDDSDDISIKSLFKKSSSKRSHKNSGSFSNKKTKKSDNFIDDDDDERNQQIFLEQENFMIAQQQQQQWFQLIQINNQMQAQINMQMMNQTQFLEKTKKHSKKKK